MNKINIALTISLLSALGIVSCHKEEKIEEQLFDTSILLGEWYNYVDGTAVDITFTTVSFRGSVYNTVNSSIEKYEDWSGMWVFNAYNRILTMDILHSATGKQTTKDYQILESNKYILTLQDQQLKSKEVYNKVVETKILYVGDEFDIEYLKTNSISASNYTSSCSYIANVDNKGHVTAVSPGIAFISISSNVGTLVAKVEVN